jgi:hypothetical protein
VPFLFSCVWLSFSSAESIARCHLPLRPHGRSGHLSANAEGLAVMRTARRQSALFAGDSEVLFINWLQTQFIPNICQLRIKANCDGSIILLLSGHANHTTLRLIACADSQRIVIRLVACHSTLKLVCLRCIQNGAQKGTKDEENERRDTEDISPHSRLLHSYNQSNGEKDFRPGWVSPKCEGSLGPFNCH